MIAKSPAFAAQVLGALCCIGMPAHAAITVFDTQAAYAAAISAPGIDGYTGFSITGSTLSPITRTAGPYGYTGTLTTGSFFGAGTTFNPWLSTNIAADTITFSAFTGGVAAVGGQFFGSNTNGQFQSGNITVVATDSLGATATRTIVGATINSFLGFVSTATMTTLTVAAVQPANSFLWPTVDNLTLALGPPPDPLFQDGFE